MTEPITEFVGPYKFLSNFYEAPVVFEGEWYPTSEHAYQAAKTTDPRIRRYIAGLPTPGKAKRAAGPRGVVTLREDWEDIKYDVMFSVVSDKFTRHPLLRDALLRTGDAMLVETNTWGDTTWGVCQGQGKNWLGQILMAVRGSL